MGIMAALNLNSRMCGLWVNDSVSNFIPLCLCSGLRLSRKTDGPKLSNNTPVAKAENGKGGC